MAGNVVQSNEHCESLLQSEHTAIADFIGHPPVLDCKFDATLSLDYEGKVFGTVTCSNILNSLCPADMARALGEMRRVGRLLVISIKTRSGRCTNSANGKYVHSFEDFFNAVNGMLIDRKRSILQNKEGSLDVYRLRKPNWNDIARQFRWHFDKERAIERLCRNWTAAYKVKTVNPWAGVVKAEFWESERLGALVDKMAETPRANGSKNAMIVGAFPRFDDYPITVLRTQGCEAIIDGRHRANQWRKRPGIYQVLTIEV